MELSPEERRKIYEEEKARLEAREHLEQERRSSSQETTVGMEPRVAGLLCYLGAWVTGIIFFVLEQKNRWVRFHAAQSLLTFGGLLIIGIILGWIPFVGDVFAGIIGFTAFVLWIILMVKAYHGEHFKLAWVGDIAERMAASAPSTVDDFSKSEPPAPAKEPPVSTQEQPGSAKEPPSTAESPAAAIADIGKKIGDKTEDFFKRKREGRITGSAFAIAWSVVLLVFFNYFHEYAAYYTAETVNGVIVWTKTPFFTDNISQWLPILTATLIFSILAHIVMIIFDRYTLRRILLFVIDALGLATVVTLISVFPFDFTIVPNDVAAVGSQIGVTVVLICIAIGLGISLLVRIIKGLVHLGRITPGNREDY